ncbi:MAG: ribbon-helix-helix protein, CopG family [Halobacteria archaeon]
MATRFTLDLNDDLYKEFSKKCIDEERSKASVVRELLEDWVDE